MANRARFRSEDVAFTGDGSDYAGDVLQNMQYSNDQAYSRGSYFDHLADFHEPPVICRGWEVTTDVSTAGAYQVSAGVGVCLDATGVPKRIETLAAVEGLLPVDTSSGTPNYIIAQWAPVDSTAEQSWLDSHEYAKDETDGCSVSVATSYDSTADVVLGVIYPTPVVGANQLMTQPWRSPDLSSPTGKAGGGINLAPNSRMVCSTVYADGTDCPDWWSYDGSIPDFCSFTAGSISAPDHLILQLFDGESIRLSLPSESARQINFHGDAVLSYEMRGNGGDLVALTVEVQGLVGITWTALASHEFCPLRLGTDWNRFAMRFSSPGSSCLGYRIIFKNDSGGSIRCDFRLANICVNLGRYAPLVPLPSGLYTCENLRFSHANGLSGAGAYFYAESINGDDFPIETPCYIGRIWVHDRTAATGGDTTIEIRVDGGSVKTVTLPKSATEVSDFYGQVLYRPGSRISVFATGPLTNGAQNIAVTVERLNLVGY